MLSGPALQPALAAVVTRFRQHEIAWASDIEFSSTVRNWIRAAAAGYQVFVSNRVGEIQTITEEDKWRFVPGLLNPADAATRSTLDGANFPSVWLTGPEFLLLSEDDWPTDLPWLLVKDESRTSRTFLASVPESPVVWTDVNLVPDNIAVLCKMESRYLELVKSCQAKTFEEETRRIQKGKHLRCTSNILALAPILDSGGILRLGGRAGRAQQHYDQLNPPLHVSSADAIEPNLESS